MAINGDLKRAICSLFEVHPDQDGVQRIITPLEYPGTNDNIIVRVRPLENGQGYMVDENGEAAHNASLNGGDVESDSIARWAEDLHLFSPAVFSENETISAYAKNERLIAPYIFRVAEAAQQLHAIATSRADRQTSDFKERVKSIVEEIASSLNLSFASDVELPIAGGLKADHVIGSNQPLIIITATSPTRLLEAEVIYLQYREEKKSGYVLAVAEDQASVGKKQYERAAYYTNKSVIFDSNAFGKLISSEMAAGIH